MAFKEYICPRWREYSIGAQVRFVNGVFATDDPELQKVVESNDSYMVHIWPTSFEEPEDGKESTGRVSPVQRKQAGKSAGSSEIVPKGSDVKGREEGNVFQELEEVVRGSGIVGGKGKKD